MVDLFTLALTHGLLALALWRLLFRPDLDAEGAGSAPARPWLKDRTGLAGAGPADRAADGAEAGAGDD